jgi:sulfite reductase alpha subunit-like flavoprotein
MTPLWNMLLRSDLPDDLFDETQFAVFGLGDTAYEKFCWPARKLCRRMQNLGATEICNLGEGDDQHRLGYVYGILHCRRDDAENCVSIDGVLDPWIGSLVDTLLRLYPLPAGLEVVSPGSLPPSRVTIQDASTKELENVRDPLEADQTCHQAVVKCNQRITADDWFQDVRHIEFEFQDNIQYGQLMLHWLKRSTMCFQIQRWGYRRDTSAGII